MKVQVFAALKDYFDKEFELTNDIKDISTLKKYLAEQNASAGKLLQICRFAVEDEFVDQSFQLKENDTVCIIPPSSGG